MIRGAQLNHTVMGYDIDVLCVVIIVVNYKWVYDVILWKWCKFVGDIIGKP